jgi:pimeloyl-ACP methyl ester carboxylesterase
MLHLHGFGMSGAYLVPTAERLAAEFQTYVPDLPGFGRSGKALRALDVTDLAHAAAAFFNDRGLDTATLVGNSMGCAVITEFARRYPHRIERAVLVAPAGGLHNQPLHRAMRELVRDGTREPPRLVPVAVPDYLRFGVPSTLRLFRALTRYPSLDRLLALRIPTLRSSATATHSCPAARACARSAGQTVNHTLLVVIEGAA